MIWDAAAARPVAVNRDQIGQYFKALGVKPQLDAAVNVTLANGQQVACRTVFNANQLDFGYHWGFDDPAKVEGSDAEIWEVFVRVRDEIKLVFEAYAAGYRDGRGEDK